MKGCVDMGEFDIHDYGIAHIRIAKYLAVYDDYERRKAEAEAAHLRLKETIAALTDYDMKVFRKLVEEYCGKEVIKEAL